MAANSFMAAIYTIGQTITAKPRIDGYRLAGG
jgi:hypothetical protein